MMPVQQYGRIVICGGGCYGGYYVRQLARARAAGALQCREIVVVDRDPDCRVARLVHAIETGDAVATAQHGWRLYPAAASEDASPAQPAAERLAAMPGDAAAYHDLPIRFVSADWDSFFARMFAAALDTSRHDAHDGHDAHDTRRDAVVPSPLMPHLLAHWVAARMAAHRPGAVVRQVPVSSAPETPWRRTAPDAAHYASFATWMCPINCIEPPRCPETRGPREWTMPAAVRLAADAAAAAGAPYDVLAIFHTTHRVYGVGMFDVADAIATDAAIVAAHERASLRVMVASVSHCHGALAELLAEAITHHEALDERREPAWRHDAAGLLL